MAGTTPSRPLGARRAPWLPHCTLIATGFAFGVAPFGSVSVSTPSFASARISFGSTSSGSMKLRSKLP